MRDQVAFTVLPTPRGGEAWYVRGPDGRSWGTSPIEAEVRILANRLNRAYALGRADEVKARAGG